MTHFENERFAQLFERWDELKQQIEASNGPSTAYIVEGIVLFKELLALGGTSSETPTTEVVFDENEARHYVLLPLNGIERLNYIESSMKHRHAFIQLDALFIETKKRVARLRVMNK